MKKVHVVGAGPAGSIAAISAIRSGNEAVISEEHGAAGVPENCSGLFSRDGLESLSQFFDYRKFIINPIHGADIYFADELFRVRGNGGKPVAFVCGRSAIDQELASRAESEGAKINYNERVNGNGAGAFRSDNIIGADGPLSQVARHFGFPSLHHFASTLQARVRLRCEDPRILQMYISNERFPGFFGWVIPHDETTADVGVGVELPHQPVHAWNHLLRLRGIENPPKPRGAIIPLTVRECTAMRIGRKNVLLTGDAAGQVKSTTGGGVIFGGNCAALAGRHFSSPGRYEMEWRIRHGTDLALHSLIHGYLASRSDSELAAFCRKIKKLNLDEYLSAKGHMDRPVRMITPSLAVHMLKNLSGWV